jgi:hypothetical protein
VANLYLAVTFHLRYCGNTHTSDMAEQPAKRVRGPVTEEPLSDIDLLPDVALVALMVNLPDEKARRRLCQSNKRAHELCRGPDVYRELVERDIFRVTEDQELLRLAARAAALENTAGSAMERGRLMGAIMNRELTLLQTLTAYKVQLAGSGPDTWHQYYTALLFLRKGVRNWFTEFEISHWPDIHWQFRIKNVITPAVRHRNLATFNACLQIDPIPIDSQTQVSSVLLQSLANGIPKPDAHYEKIRQYKGEISSAGRVIEETLTWILQNIDGNKAMLRSLLHTDAVLGSGNSMLAPEFARELHQRTGATRFAVIVNLVSQGSDLEIAASVLDAIVRWLAGNRSLIERVKISLGEMTYRPSASMQALLDEKLK